MKKIATSLDGVFILEPDVFEDERGVFYESWNAATLADVLGMRVDFVQGNYSRSTKGVIRGLHYQLPSPQAKLIRCIGGGVWDVVVDIRRSSPTFGEWAGIELTGGNRRQLWVPQGFAHGFLALTDGADLFYEMTTRYDVSADKAIRWDDPELGIGWPLEGSPRLSDRDAAAPLFTNAVVFD